jgi:hypothetical protein
MPYIRIRWRSSDEIEECCILWYDVNKADRSLPSFRRNMLPSWKVPFSGMLQKPQKTIFFIVTAVKTSNLTYCLHVHSYQTKKFKTNKYESHWRHSLREEQLSLNNGRIVIRGASGILKLISLRLLVQCELCSYDCFICNKVEYLVSLISKSYH